MRRHYGKYLRGTLKDKLDEFLEGSHEEMVSLYEELGIAKAMCGDSLTLAEKAFESSNPELRATARATVHQSIDFVKEVVLACDKLEKGAEDKVSARVLSHFVSQVAMTVEDVFGDDPRISELMKRLDDLALPADDVDPCVTIKSRDDERQDAYTRLQRAYKLAEQRGDVNGMLQAQKQLSDLAGISVGETAEDEAPEVVYVEDRKPES